GRVSEFSSPHSSRDARRSKYVDYRGVMADKRRVLERLAKRFFSHGEPRRREQFARFLRESKGVHDYAEFRAVTDRQRKGWPAWPERLRDGTIRKTDYDEATRNYHLYVQWIIQDQLHTLSKAAAARGQSLSLDFPLVVNRAGYDIWRNRDFFVDGAAGGPPPAPFFTKGKNWVFPPMNPEAMRLNRY